MNERAASLGQLAELVGGQVEGDPATVIRGAASLGEVQAGEITLVDQPERTKQFTTTHAAAAVIPDKLDWNTGAGVGNESEIATARGAIRVADVHAAFAKIVLYFRPARRQPAIGVSSHAFVSRSARWGKGVNIHAGATIGDDCQIGDGTTILPGAHVMAGCRIGREVTIGPGAVLYENTEVGDRSIVHANVVLGCHGFGYSQAGGRHVPAAQLGCVRIGSDVEIGAGTTIDRGTYGATSIGDGTKIDNLVQIAHNCRIGRHNLICSQVGVAGSTTTGDYVVMGGQAGVRDHVHIGTGAKLSAMAGITNDVPDGAVMMGIPATPEREQKLKQAALAKLHEMRKEFKSLRATVDEMTKSLARDTNQPRRSDHAA
jgi:UDP-3-O-[3-hydroxymyristoyl] glucosamine N-acyltransferase